MASIPGPSSRTPVMQEQRHDPATSRLSLVARNTARGVTAMGAASLSLQLKRSRASGLERPDALLKVRKPVRVKGRM